MTTSSNIISEAAEKLLLRRSARNDLNVWARLNGYEPAKHHLKINEDLMQVEQGNLKYLIIMMPPGSAKSTYTSYLFVPHYLGLNPDHKVLACSYSHTFASTWGKKCRNLIALREKELGYGLKADSRAADEWETTKDGLYFCAGVNAGIAGHRADLVLIDDFVGNKEDAFSDLYNDKVWSWYTSDVEPRMKPSASVVIICNHRHHQDLVSRLLERDGAKWKVLKFPFFAEDNDVLGRLPGERLWPEWFTEEQASKVRSHPEFSGLYQQNPTPESGDFFKREWITSNMYDPQTELPHESELSFYCGSDHAVSEEQRADLSCLLPVAVDSRDVLWILPDIFWTRANSALVVDAMVAMMKRRNPRIWWAEKGQISKSIGPFLKKAQQDARVYNYIEEVTPSKEKKVRAQSIQARMQTGMVRWPKGTQWLDSAIREMMEFPVGAHDDFVDALAHIGMGLAKMVKGRNPHPYTVEKPKSLEDITLKYLKESTKPNKFLVLQDN